MRHFHNLHQRTEVLPDLTGVLTTVIIQTSVQPDTMLSLKVAISASVQVTTGRKSPVGGYSPI